MDPLEGLQEEVEVGVILADTCHVFGPLSEGKPDVLQPLCGRAFLDYTLALLYSSGVREVVVLCCRRFGSELKAFVSASPRARAFKSARVVCHEGSSVGDAMRQVYEAGLVRAPHFVLALGCVLGACSGWRRR